MSRLSDRLVRMLATEGIEWPGGKANCRIERIYPSADDKAVGRWDWTLLTTSPTNVVPKVGSCYPAADCVRYGFDVAADRWHNNELYPKYPDGRRPRPKTLKG